VIVEHMSRRKLGERELIAGRTGVDETLFWIGAAEQVLAAGGLAEVLPAEDEIAYEQGDPLTSDGELRFDSQANDARQAAIVRRLLGKGPLAVVVLGADHDLSEQVRQLGGGRCEYVRVRTGGMPVADHSVD
jgi:hypothetical protein